MHKWTCTTCSQLQHVPGCYASMQQPSTIRCIACGEPHHIDKQVVSSRIGPAMLPVNAPAAQRYSPWRPWTTRPAHSGLYEVRFNTLQLPLVLWWSRDHQAFHPGHADTRRVICAELQCWRGKWANS